MMLWNRFAVAAVLLMAGTASAVAGAFVDPIDQPAKASALAPRSPIFALARAGERLVAAGSRGHVLWSEDAGTTWHQAKVPVSVDLVGLSFADAQQGWAVGHGGVVLHSADGGKTWVRQRGEARSDPFLDVYFWNSRSGFVVGPFGRILRTDDGGASWIDWKARVDNPGELHLISVRGKGERIFLVGEQGRVWRLEGETAAGRFVAAPTPYAGTLFGLHVGEGTGVLAFGMRGALYRSADDGVSWAAVKSSTAAGLTAATAMPDGRIVLVDQAGGLLASRDAGASFSRLQTSSPMPSFALVRASDGGIAVGGAAGLAIKLIP